MTVPRSVRKFLYVKICLKHRLFVLIREDAYVYLHTREIGNECISWCFAKTCVFFLAGRQTYISFFVV